MSRVASSTITSPKSNMFVSFRSVFNHDKTDTSTLPFTSADYFMMQIDKMIQITCSALNFSFERKGLQLILLEKKRNFPMLYNPSKYRL